MPSLMPGRPGTKEAFGFSIIREELEVSVPPKALARYGLKADDEVVLTTTHRGEGGFALLIPDRARETVFAAYLARLTRPEKVYWFLEKAYTAVVLREGRLFLTPEILQAIRRGGGQTNCGQEHHSGDEFHPGGDLAGQIPAAGAGRGSAQHGTA